MPRKIDFGVVYATDEDPKHKSFELNEHGPTVKGWQSSKNCDYPQEIVLELSKRCCLEKIQILAHQYLISSKIELFSSNEDTNTVTDVTDINWEYLGYITLSDNQSTGFKSRELKSANVPKCMASFVKMKLHKNHNNSYNINNQVSLIAINVLGTETEPKTPSHATGNAAEKLNVILNDPGYVSPYDDLAFEMYVDADVVKIIRDMEIKKYLAVLDERFEYARKLKQTMENLREAGEKLGKYDLEKKHAIEMEDYERARHKKNQMDEYRGYVYQQLAVEQLLETDGICQKNDECSEEIDNAVHLMSPTLLRVPDKRSSSPSPHNLSQVSPLHVPRHQSPKTGSPGTGSPTNIQSRGSFRRRNKSAGAIIKSTYEQYEEKPLPTLRHSQTNEFLRECQIDYDCKQSSKLTEREKKQAALPILVFGTDLVEKFYSKHYLDKEEGLNMLKEDLLGYSNTRMHTANKTGRAAIFLLHRSLRDKVFSVYSLANEVIRLFFVQYVPGRVSPPEVSRSVDKLLPELLTKSGDTSARIHHMAVHTILTMADCKSVRDLHLIPVHLSRPVNSSTHPRLALSRAEMVEQLILSHGISSDKQSGLTCRTLSEFGSSGLHHPAEAVRKVAERILVLVYKVNPRLVRKQLPPDDDITRRNLLYRQLFQEFDKIDIQMDQVMDMYFVLWDHITIDIYFQQSCLSSRRLRLFKNDFQRKKEMLERNRVIQQSPTTTIQDSNPEPVAIKNGINKCQSSTNIINMAALYNEQVGEQTNGQGTHYALTKSISGGNLGFGAQNKTDGANEQSTSSASGISSPSNNSQKEQDEKQCIFCHQSETSIFAISNSMNSHYWRSCPMLVRCRACSQVIEVLALTEHLLMECEHKEQYTQCSQCTEALRLEEYELHTNNCTELTEGCYRCPLCHKNIEDEENAWKNHLMGEKPCSKNARLKNLPKQVKIKA